MKVKDIIDRIIKAFKSAKGRNVVVLSIFLIISTLMWCVISFNELGLVDVRMPVKINNVPDSVTIVSKYPQSVSVSLRTKGTQLLRLNWGQVPEFNIDFRMYDEGNKLHLSDPDMKAVARNSLDGAEIAVVAPDSLSIMYTSLKPTLLPVKLDYVVATGSQAVLYGAPILSIDSVKVYSIERLNSDVKCVETEPVRINAVNESVSQRIKLIAPSGTRVIPDSIDVTFNVEPLILKTRKVSVDAINVPADKRLITFPAQVEVAYMMALSDYKTAEPYIHVTADYSSIKTGTSRMVKLNVDEISDDIRNVHLATDSVEYIIEQL